MEAAGIHKWKAVQCTETVGSVFFRRPGPDQGCSAPDDDASIGNILQ